MVFAFAGLSTIKRFLAMVVINGFLRDRRFLNFYTATNLTDRGIYGVYILYKYSKNRSLLCNDSARMWKKLNLPVYRAGFLSTKQSYNIMEMRD